MKNHLLKIALLLILCSFAVTQENITVYMIGDSTMSVKDPTAGLAQAPGSPDQKVITVKWAFDGKWFPSEAR
ncbi:hypothetical protein [Daejeonella sp.]|uniref:hypothetical protein n=1 Tax=Daejeonella sp. TaxID=2805397 RepID=UPI0030BFEAB3